MIKSNRPGLMSSSAIKLEKVSYKYPGTDNWALRDINLKIPRGSFSVIVGPSGSGKTTLLLIARGFAKEYGGTFRGKVFIEDKDIKRQSIAQLGSSIGLIFQNPALQLHQLRVIDEVASAPMYQGLPFAECQKRAQEITNNILGREFYERSPADLSSGEQQKTALAATLSMKADILLLDEPFSFLDAKSDQELLKIILNLHREGKTIVVATHDIEIVAPYANQVALLDQGRLVKKDKPTEALYSDQFEKILTTPVSIKLGKSLFQKGRIKEKSLDWKKLVSIPKTRKLKAGKRSKRKPAILSLENVSFSYPEGKVGVKNIDLDIFQNEILGIIGPNGSGKTTLAKLILGLLKTKGGKIKLENKDLAKMDVYQRARKIGFVTQDPMDMFFETNILDECAAGPRFLGLANPEEKAKKTLKQLNILKYKDRHPDSLSGGEKSLLGIADILVNNPEILLLDEPEFGLDPKNWKKIVKIIKDLKKKGKTIIVITQDLEIALFLCDRIALIKEGKILKIDTPKRVFSDFNLLKQANLAVLPIFKLLNQVSDEALESEEEFIKDVTK